LEPALSRPRRSLAFIATIGALALALPLAACGRKGPLDPPPGGHVLDRGAIRTPTTAAGALPPRDAPPPPDAQPAYDENGRPIPPQGQKKKFIGDWLID
jgi:predicted small lipoprotein YifL